LVRPKRVAQFVKGVDRRFVLVEKFDPPGRQPDPLEFRLAAHFRAHDFEQALVQGARSRGASGPDPSREQTVQLAAFDEALLRSRGECLLESRQQGFGNAVGHDGASSLCREQGNG
jgi:hypothetical protein